jgi:hypothetical protein
MRRLFNEDRFIKCEEAGMVARSMMARHAQWRGGEEDLFFVGDYIP